MAKKKKLNETQKHTSGCRESGMGWLGTSDEGSRCGPFLRAGGRLSELLGPFSPILVVFLRFNQLVRK